MSHGFLTAWETSELPGLRSCPVIARRGDSPEPVAACPGYFWDMDMVGIRFPAAAGLMAALRKLWPRLLVARTYELGNPTPLTNPFLVPEDEDRTEAVGELTRAALAEAERSSADFILVQNLTSLTGPAARTCLPLGFAGVPILPTVVVHLPYRSFDEYLSAMRSSYRRRVRQAFQRSNELTVEHRRDFAELAVELAALWGLIYERATEIRREKLTAEFFRQVSVLDETSVLLLRREDGTIASFALLLDEGSWLSFLQCGFDAAAGRSEGAYFRLLYEIVRVAIEGGFDYAELGMTTVAPKLDIGGVPVPLFALIRHRNRLVQRAIRLYAERLIKEDELHPRNVFKEAPPSAAEIVAQR